MWPLVALSIVFLLVIAVITLRFTTILRQILDGLAMDRRDRASELDHAHTQAFSNAMTAMETINQRIVQSQTAMFDRTVDMMVGPQQTPGEGGGEPDPKLDNRVMWQPDDAFDYSALGLDPTDDLLPDPPLEPNDNESRAVMLPPGEGLLP